MTGISSNTARPLNSPGGGKAGFYSDPDCALGSGAIRDFFGGLDRLRATKGLFVTTSDFSKDARETANQLSKRIVLIDGLALTDLMVRFSVGCQVVETFQLQRIDEEFFEEG